MARMDENRISSLFFFLVLMLRIRMFGSNRSIRAR